MATPTEAGTVTGMGDYTEDATVTCVATPNAHWSFVEWTKDGVQVSEDRIYDYTMPATGATLTANFEPLFSLSLTANPSEAGTVTGMGEYTEGSTVTVTSTPNQYWTFVNWTKNGAQVSIESNFVYTIPATSATLTANFEWDVANVSLSNLVEDTQFEMYDGTDFGYWQVYIHPDLIAQLPNTGTYKLVIGDDIYDFEQNAGDIYATVPENEHDEQDIKDNGVVIAVDTYSAPLSTLTENTQYEMYDGTDFGYWQVYIFPALIPEIPDTGTYQLNIGTDQYLFEQNGGDVYATVPENEHDEQGIKDNGVIVAY